MRHAAVAVTMVFVMLAWPAVADDHRTFQSFWAEATGNPNCKPPADHTDYILVSCDSETTLWYFTKPNHPAHPAFVKRIMQQDAGGSWTAHQDAKSFARASGQPAFQAWYADLDRQMREELNRRSSSASARPNR